MLSSDLLVELVYLVMSQSKTSAYQAYSSASRKSSKYETESYADRKGKSRDRKHHRHRSSDSDDDVKTNQPKSLLSLSFKGPATDYSVSHRHTSTSSSSKHKKHRSRSRKKKADSSSSEEDSGEDLRSKSHRRSKNRSDSEGDDFRHDSAEENGREKRSWRESSKPQHTVSVRPVVVDMSKRNYDRYEDHSKRSSNVERKPKSLFDTYIPPPKAKPVSLLSLPNRGAPVTKHGQSFSSKESYNNRHSYDAKPLYNNDAKPLYNNDIKPLYNNRRRDDSNNKRRYNTGNNSDDEREYSSKRYQRENEEGKRELIISPSNRYAFKFKLVFNIYIRIQFSISYQF